MQTDNAGSGPDEPGKTQERESILAVTRMEMPATILTRRRWLQAGGLGVLGLSLPQLRCADAGRRTPVRSCLRFLLHGRTRQIPVVTLGPSLRAVNVACDSDS